MHNLKFYICFNRTFIVPGAILLPIDTRMKLVYRAGKLNIHKEGVMTTDWDSEPRPHYDSGYREERMERGGIFYSDWEREHRRVQELEAQLQKMEQIQKREKKAEKKKEKHSTKVVIKLGGGTAALALFILVFFFHISWFWFFVLLVLFLILG